MEKSKTINQYGKTLDFGKRTIKNARIKECQIDQLNPVADELERLSETAEELDGRINALGNSFGQLEDWVQKILWTLLHNVSEYLRSEKPLTDEEIDELDDAIGVYTTSYGEVEFAFPRITSCPDSLKDFLAEHSCAIYDSIVFGTYKIIDGEIDSAHLIAIDDDKIVRNVEM